MASLTIKLVYLMTLYFPGFTFRFARNKNKNNRIYQTKNEKQKNEKILFQNNVEIIVL